MTLQSLGVLLLLLTLLVFGCIIGYGLLRAHVSGQPNDTPIAHVTVIFHQGAPPDPASPPASVTGQPGLSGKPADSPPVAGDGGETG